jgi:hypothetical protein
VIHDPDSLRKALVSILDDLELHNRTWLAASDSDVAPVNQAGTLGAMLAAEAIRPPRGWSLHTWFTEMVKPHVYGDSNILLGALLLCRLRIHVLTTQSFLGFITLKVPASFGDEYQPIYPDIWLANLADHHYFSTTVLGQNVPPQPQHAQVQSTLHRLTPSCTAPTTPIAPHRTELHRTAPHHIAIARYRSAPPFSDPPLAPHHITPHRTEPHSNTPSRTAPHYITTVHPHAPPCTSVHQYHPSAPHRTAPPQHTTEPYHTRATPITSLSPLPFPL